MKPILDLIHTPEYWEIVDGLRQRALSGSTPSALLRWLGTQLYRLDPADQDHKSMSIWFFMDSFLLDMKDVLAVTAWSEFSFGNRSDQEIDAVMQERIERHKSEWSARIGLPPPDELHYD